MNSRERITAILHRELPDQMGLFDHFWPETLSQYWPEQGFPAGADPHRFFDHDIQPFGGPDTAIWPGRYEPIEETDEWRVVKDGMGASLKLWKNKSGTPEHIDFELTTPAKWHEAKISLLEYDPRRLGTPEQQAEIRRKLEETQAAGKFVTLHHLYIFEFMRAAIGDVHFLPALLREPAWIRDFCQTWLDFLRTHLDAWFREIGRPDAGFFYDDIGYTNGLFCSPRTLRELILPFWKELVGFYHDHGLPVIMHTCGDVRKALPTLIEAGIDCLQPMEAKAGMDVVELAKEYGDQLSFMGNINVVPWSTNDPEAIRSEIEPKLRAMRAMRQPYVFHSDHSIPPTITLESYRLGLEIFRENCRY